jgi:hypothetical protein
LSFFIVRFLFPDRCISKIPLVRVEECHGQNPRSIHVRAAFAHREGQAPGN